MTDLANATPQQTRKNVQAHILRAAKFGLVDQLVTYGPAPGKTSADPGAASAVASDAPPKASKDDASSAAPSEPDAPATAFLAWLKAVVSADKSGIQNTADQILNLPKSGDGPQPVTPNLNLRQPDVRQVQSTRYESGYPRPQCTRAPHDPRMRSASQISQHRRRRHSVRSVPRRVPPNCARD
jgi:peptidoglycan hydrolase-like protein with peptidoglycan-binding domain